MGFVQTEARKKMEIEEMKCMLAACGGLSRRKDDEEFQGIRASSKQGVEFNDEEELVCVTSGVSYLGLAIVNRLLTRGYSVRIIVDNEEDKEKLRELETSGEMRTSKNGILAVMAKLTEVESLVEAFQGCHGVFHTSAFTDPAGLSGYTNTLSENCVVTSSLLTCLWRDITTTPEFPPVVNHESWSDESLCIRNKLWYAVGKLRAEKAAWKIAKERGLKLVTICPGLITGPEYFGKNPTATIAYLKGGQEMFRDGLLATVDVMNLADAHARVFEEMKKTAYGRYICFDRVIQMLYCRPPRFVLSNKKLCNLMSRTHRSCYDRS
ncbi:tetraketide alpha-pyrone reductase [Salix suchowensis]|nr:tetraketide alpha-pyrone reductase [Salix suchowensis]